MRFSRGGAQEDAVERKKEKKERKKGRNGGTEGRREGGRKEEIYLLATACGILVLPLGTEPMYPALA